MKFATALLPLLLVNRAGASNVCSSQTGHDLAEEVSFDVENGTYKLSVSWVPNTVMSEAATCPGDSDVECGIDLADDIAQATGIQGVSVDFTCGHTGRGLLTPHYHVHFYRYALDVRRGWTCERGSGPPTCKAPDENYTQPEASGRAFFNVAQLLGSDQPANMPADFACGPTSGGHYKGVHCLDPATVPATPADWKLPILVVGSYDGDTSFIEPMAPLGFVTGEDGFQSSYSADIEYKGQTIMNLPDKYSWDTNAEGRTTLVLEGTATPSKSSKSSKSSKKGKAGKKRRALV